MLTTRKLTTRSLTIAATVGILITALTGCAVSVTTPGEDTKPDSAETQTQDAAPEEDTAPEEDAAPEEAADSGPTEWSAKVDAQYQTAVASVTKTATCDGELVLGGTAPAEIVRVEDPCDHLVIDMDGGIVVAGEVTNLEVNGAGSVTFVDAVEAIDVSGDGVVVYWLGTTPTVDDTGDNNVLTAG